jgi:uncharacterized glyoxalase superfamily protein PhnB
MDDDTTFTASVYYEDPKAALAWLVDAFGFEITMAIDGPPESPEMCHYEMALEGNGRVMVGGQWTPAIRSPRGLDGANTQSLHVQLGGGLDAHCARATLLGQRSSRSPRTSSMAIGPTVPSTSKATCGPLPSTCAM